MTETIQKRLKTFLFPVEERKVYFDNPGSSPKLSRDYKAIVRSDKNELISVMQDSYKLISNYDLIMPLLEQLHQLDTKWTYDNSHSFVESTRMRMQITFPDLTLNDGRSDIALSLFAHNSYNGVEGIRILWGGIRAICSNGAIWGAVLAKFYSKHTKNANLGNIKQQLEQTYDQIPIIKERIEILQHLQVTDTIREQITDTMGKNVSKYVEQQMTPAHQWALYNILTYYVSHLVDQRMRTAYLLKVSKIFKL